MRLTQLLLRGLILTGFVASSTTFVGSAFAQDEDDEDDNAPPPIAENASPEVFHDVLSPYGQWINVPGYGQVWQPNPNEVGADFVPYSTGGAWVDTDYGWSFNAGYSWGWAPFHYGRWFMQPNYGWMWAPGVEWGPAWVNWRYGGGYVGWAPLGPAGYGVNYGVYGNHWNFVDHAHFLEPNVYRYALPPGRASVVFAGASPVRTTVAYGNRTFFAGPPAGSIAAAVGHPVNTVHVSPPARGTVQAVGLPRNQSVANQMRSNNNVARPSNNSNVARPAENNAFARPAENNQQLRESEARPQSNMNTARPTPAPAQPQRAYSPPPSHSSQSSGYHPAPTYHAPASHGGGGGRRR